MSVIQLTNVSKNFKQTKALDHISISVDEHEIYGFIGPNGAGKSTAIKCLLNYIFPTSGNLFINGQDVTKYSSIIKKKVGYIPSEVNFYSDMKVIDLLETSMKFHHNKNIKLLEELSTLFEIENHKKFKELSLGNKKKVAIVSALLHEPFILIMDEPTNGLDPLMQQRLFQYLYQKRNEMTIFLSSHNLTEIQDYCTKVAFIKKGKIIDIIDLNTIRTDHKVLELSFTSSTDYSSYQLEILHQNDTSLQCVFKENIDKLPFFLQCFTLTNLKVTPYDLTMKFMNFYEGDN